MKKNTKTKLKPDRQEASGWRDEAVFFPLSDENPLKRIEFQYMTLAIIAVNIVVFVFSMSGIDHAVVASFAVVPNELLAVAGYAEVTSIPHNTVNVPEAYTLVSYMFFHADFFHILGNMLFLWVFGDNVEDAVGHIKFLIFYLLCGIASGLVHTFMLPDSTAPLIGASGAVAGVIAAYLMLHPRVRVWVLALPIFPFQVTAALALGAWIVYQIIMVVFPQAGPVAWWAHIGGLIAGAVLILFMRRPGVPLFDQNLRSA